MWPTAAGPDLEQNEAVSPGQTAGPKRVHDLARVSREGAAKCLAIQVQHGTVVMGVGDEQHGTVDAAVTPLGLGASLQGLDVAQARLGVDPDRAWAVEPDTSRSEVTARAYQRLGAPGVGRVGSFVEPVEQPLLRFVANGQAVRVRLGAQAQPKGGTVGRELVDPNRHQCCALRPADARLAQTCRAGDEALAQAGGEARLTKLTPEV